MSSRPGSVHIAGYDASLGPKLTHNSAEINRLSRIDEVDSAHPAADRHRDVDRRSPYHRGMGTLSIDMARVVAICERYGIARLDVFGSVARGDDRSDSDVDLLYELKPGTRLGFALFDAEDELSEVFGRRVDLVARKAVNRHLRDSILREARRLYAA